MKIILFIVIALYFAKEFETYFRCTTFEKFFAHKSRSHKDLLELKDQADTFGSYTVNVAYGITWVVMFCVKFAILALSVYGLNQLL